jgi:hypothetical protein
MPGNRLPGLDATPNPGKQARNKRHKHQHAVEATTRPESPDSLYKVARYPR